MRDFNQNLLDMGQAVQTLKAGGIIIYPTENFLALACLPTNCDAVEAIFQCKTRPKAKPLPLIAGDLMQAGVAARLDFAPTWLLGLFWPGPLTVVLPGTNWVYGLVTNVQGKVAIRIPFSLAARELCQACQSPLTATSANISAQPPAASFADLDPALLAALASSGLPWGCLNAASGNQDMPSTIVEPEHAAGRWRLRILREGAIKRQELACQEWDLL